VNFELALAKRIGFVPPPMSEDEFSYFEYFSGYVPSGAVFLMSANDIVQIAHTSAEESSSCLNSLCLIGLASYFEAFTKDQLGSVISLAPELIERLQRAGYSTDFPAEEAYEFRDSLQYKIGFLIAQRLDLGSAKKINSVFTSVLQITPFGQKDVVAYDRLLRDRNLLVHHGGTYTTSYIRQAFGEIPPQKRRAHGDSLEVTAKRIADEATFLKRIARNVVQLSATRVEALLKERYGTLPKEVHEAVSAMTYWDDDTAA
jgi:hypothetical protein